MQSDARQNDNWKLQRRTSYTSQQQACSGLLFPLPAAALEHITVVAAVYGGTREFQRGKCARARENLLAIRKENNGQSWKGDV